MTESQRRCALIGFRRRLEVVYNQIFADVELILRQQWIAEDQEFMRIMIEEDDISEAKASRMVLQGRMLNNERDMP